MPQEAALTLTTDISETRPMWCAHVGLTCETCIRDSAARVASLCASLGEQQQTDLFFQLYPDQYCRTKSSRFRREYTQITGVAQPLTQAAASGT